MKQRFIFFFVALLLLATSEASAQVSPTVLGSWGTGVYRDADPRAAEIPAYDPATRRLFVVRSFPGPQGAVDVLNFANPAAPTRLFSIVFAGSSPNSVDTRNGIVAVALEDTVKTRPGRVAFFNANADSLTAATVRVFATVGSLPDMLTFTPDGRRVITANEGEPNNYLTTGNDAQGTPNGTNPEGSVSIITVPTGAVAATGWTPTVQAVGFTAFNTGGARAGEVTIGNTGVRIYGPRATFAQDIEPEYVTVLGDSAFVNCQEANCVAIIRISTGAVQAIRPYGFKDHSVAGRGFDASDRGTAINIVPRPVRGLYQPDAIEAYQVGNQTFIVTANEGDSRTAGDFPGFEEEARAGVLRLDPAVFGDTTRNGSVRNDTTGIGRLNITTAMPDTTASGLYRVLYSYGARSFSIFRVDPTALTLVFDSGDQLERIIQQQFPANFNAGHTTNALKNRSDDKGPEPEGLALGRIGDSTFAFIGMERISGVMIFNINNPAAPTFVQYVSNRNFALTPGVATVLGGTATGPAAATVVGDLGQEGVIFVPGGQSPNNRPLVITANEVSGTVTAIQLSNVLSVERLVDVTPQGYALEQNYPNPFNPTTNIKYSIPQAAQVSLKVYDMLGREVATVVNQRQTAGVYVAGFNATSLSSGVYFYRLQAGSFTQTNKMMLVK